MCSDFGHQDPLAGFSVVLILPKGEVTFHIEQEKRQIDVAQSADRSNGYSRLYAAALIQSKKSSQDDQGSQQRFSQQGAVCQCNILPSWRDLVFILREWLDKSYPLDQRKSHPKI